MEHNVDVLIVEDSVTQAEQLQAIVTSAGLSAMVAHNGREAIKLLETVMPSVIIADVVMPEMDGYEMCLKVKEDPRLSGVAVMMLTSLSDAGDVIRGLEAKADYYFTKPYDVYYIITQVKAILSGKGVIAEETGQARMDVDVDGVRREVVASSQQILNLLISTYQCAIRQNRALMKAELEQTRLNQLLKDRVRERTDELKATEANLWRLLESASDAVVVTWPDATICYANPSAERLFQRPSSALVGEEFPYPLALNATEELQLVDSEGNVLHVDLHVTETLWDGQPAYLASMHDVTERKIAQEKLAEQAAEMEEAHARLSKAYALLKQLDDQKTEFLTSASQELQAPLTIIRECVTLVSDGLTGAVDAKQKECLASALANCDRLGSLLDDFLDIQRSQVGKIRIHRQRVDVGALLKSCCRDLETTFRSRGREIQFEATEKLPFVLCDPDKICQVVSNLIGNADKIAGDQGRLLVRAFRSDESVTIEIVDSGQGISDEEQQTLFDSYAPLDRRSLSVSGSTSLALGTARALVELHESNLTVAGEPGKGARFAFNLPIHREDNEFEARIHDCRDVSTTLGRDLHLTLIRVSARPEVKPSDKQREVVAAVCDSVQAVAREVFRRRDDEVFRLQDESMIGILAMTGAEDCDYLGTDLENRIVSLSSQGCTCSRIAIEISDDRDPQEWLVVANQRFDSMPAGARRFRRVLAIDEETAGLEEITAALLRRDPKLTIQTATNGFSACVTFSKFKPDLVVMDMRVPKSDAFKVLDAIRDDKRATGAQILVVSGYPQDLEDLRSMGVDGMITRPVDANTLHRELERLCAEHPADTGKTPDTPRSRIREHIGR